MRYACLQRSYRAELGKPRLLGKVRNDNDQQYEGHISPGYKKEGIFSLGAFILNIRSCSRPNGQPQPQMILPPTAPIAPRKPEGIQRKMIHAIRREKLQYAEGAGKDC